MAQDLAASVELLAAAIEGIPADRLTVRCRATGRLPGRIPRRLVAAHAPAAEDQDSRVDFLVRGHISPSLHRWRCLLRLGYSPRCSTNIGQTFKHPSGGHGVPGQAVEWLSLGRRLQPVSRRNSLAKFEPRALPRHVTSAWRPFAWIHPSEPCDGSEVTKMRSLTGIQLTCQLECGTVSRECLRCSRRGGPG